MKMPLELATPRRAGLIAAFLFCVGLAGGPLPTAWAQSPIDLTILANDAYTPENALPDVAAAYKEAWAKFSADNPGVTVKLQKIRSGPDAIQEVLTAASAGQLPDIGILDPGWLPRLQIGGYLQPLDGTLTAADEADFLPGVLDSGTLDGHLRGIFFYNSWRGLFYRPSAVKKLGYDAPPSDWDGFLKFGDAALKAGYKDVLLFPALKSELTMLYLLPQYFGLGGELYDKTGKPDFFNPPNRAKLEQVMQLWRDLVVRKFMPPEVGAMDEVAERPFFYSGETITVGSSTSFTKQMLVDQASLNGDLSVVPLPLPAGATPVPLLSNWGYVIFTKDPVRAEAAKKFIRYMVSAEVLGKLNALQGQLPVRRSIWETSPAFSQSDLMKQLYKIQNDPRLRSAASKFPIYPAVKDAISEQMAAVIAGTLTPAQAVDKARDSALAAYERLQR